MLRRSCLRRLLWFGIHHCYYISMQPCAVLLESNNPWWPLHQECSILDLLRGHQYHNGFLYPVLADANSLFAVVVEEE